MESAALNATLKMEDLAPVMLENPEKKWIEHCKTAVRRFLKNVVIIDNEPVVNAKDKNHTSVNSLTNDISANTTDKVTTDDHLLLESPEDGLKEKSKLIGSNHAKDESNRAEVSSNNYEVGESKNLVIEQVPEEETHFLDVRTVSDAFAEAGLACAFVLPELDNDDLAKVTQRSLAAASTSDIVVLDWYLQGKSSVLTQQILRKIAEADSSANGRLRLICIYTGQSDVESVLYEAAAALKEGGIETTLSAKIPNCMTSQSCLLMVLNKHKTQARVLPETIVDAFVALSDGLVPSFALAAVGAIRNNIHHMLTRFDANLDPAYIGNRLITDPPEDVAELMRDLLISECDNSLAFDSVTEDFLSATAIRKWIAARHKAPFTPLAEKGVDKEIDATPILEQVLQNISADRKTSAASYNTEIGIIQETEKHIRGLIKAIKVKREDTRIRVTKLDHVSLELVENLLTHGINEKGANPPPGNSAKFEIAEKNRKFICGYLAGSMENSKSAQDKFSRLVGLRKEAFGLHKRTWDDVNTPSLTTGSVLRLKEVIDGKELNRYLLCLTPACDTLRLDEQRAFSFIEAFESGSSHNLVIKDEKNATVYLTFDTKLPQISTFIFMPNNNRRRVTSKSMLGDKEYTFEFTDTSNLSFTWMGELRYNRVVSEIGKITGNWMRIGVVDSEYLRIMSKA